MTARAARVEAPPPRRTQQARRSATVARVLDATSAALGEVGYPRTTMQEIAQRAGVSVGGVFRHFPSRLDVVVAAADHVRARQFDSFRAGLATLGTDSVMTCLRLLRAACRAPINAAWYELLNAARSDAELRERLAPVAARYHAEIAAFGRTLSVAREIPGHRLDMVLFTVVHLLDGEALSAAVHAQPAQEGPRLELLAALLTSELVTRP